MADYIRDLISRANAGDGASMYKLGLCYLNGDNVDKDLGKALEWVRRSVWHGVPRAGRLVGQLLKDSDIEEAFFYYLHAAKDGDIHAQYCVGCFYDGSVKNATIPPINQYTANIYFKMAADGGSKFACESYAVNLANGYGCAQDVYEAKKYAEMGAKAGNVECMYIMGCLCNNSYYRGIVADPKASRYWLSEAAKYGHQEAAKMLGR